MARGAVPRALLIAPKEVHLRGGEKRPFQEPEGLARRRRLAGTGRPVQPPGLSARPRPLLALKSPGAWWRGQGRTLAEVQPHPPASGMPLNSGKQGTARPGIFQRKNHPPDPVWPQVSGMVSLTGFARLCME